MFSALFSIQFDTELLEGEPLRAVPCPPSSSSSCSPSYILLLRVRRDTCRVRWNVENLFLFLILGNDEFIST
jgi:hypothetical protein